MTQTLRQRRGIHAGNVIPRTMPVAWRRNNTASVTALVGSPRRRSAMDDTRRIAERIDACDAVPVQATAPTWLDRISERLWRIHDHGMQTVWLLAAVVIGVVDVVVIAALIAGIPGAQP